MKLPHLLVFKISTVNGYVESVVARLRADNMDQAIARYKRYCIRAGFSDFKVNPILAGGFYAKGLQGNILVARRLIHDQNQKETQ